MTTLRRTAATALTGGALWACTTLSGVADLEATSEENVTPNGADAATSTSSGATSGGGSTSSSTGGETSGGLADAALDGASSSGDAASDASSSSSSSSSTGGVDAGHDSGGTPPTVFRDDFNRAASPDLGNGWIEKTNHFSIQENKLAKTGTIHDGYFNMVCFSPLAGRDVQIDLDVVFPSPDTGVKAFPQLVLRAPADTVSTYNTYDGYTFWFTRNDSGIDREEKPTDTYTSLFGKAVSPVLEVGVTYHVRFSAIGVNPTKLHGTVTDTRTSVVVIDLSYDDSDQNKQITAPGAVGIGAGNDSFGIIMDNFVETVFDAKSGN